MNILLIAMPYLSAQGRLFGRIRKSYAAFPYGLLSMATYVKKHSKKKINIEIFDCNIQGDSYEQELKKKMEELNPDIIGLSIMFDSSFVHIKEILCHILSNNKNNHKNPLIIAGGAATTQTYKELLLSFHEIYAIAFSEGEIPFLELINQDNPIKFLNSHPSWITRNMLSQNETPQKTVANNIDDIIDIDYSLIDIEKYNMKEGFSPMARYLSGKKQKQFPLLSSRGCPFKCSFCMKSVDDDKSIRYASVEKIISHVKYLIDNYGLTVLTFYDDQILLNKKRAKKLFRELAQFNIRIECPNGLSVAFIDDELASLMRKAGMDTACLAIESGSEYVLNELMNKPLKLKIVKPVIDILRKYDFWIFGFFVWGYPGETDEQRKETVEFIKSIQLDWVGDMFAIPIRGTKLYNLCVENGYIKDDFKIDEDINIGYIINTPEYTPEYIANQIQLINLEINFVNNRRMKIQDYKTASISLKEIAGRTQDHAFARYYLSKCLENIESKKHLAQKEMDIFLEIIERDEKWREYANHFQLV